MKPSLKQSRRAVSIPGALYDLIAAQAERWGVSVTRAVTEVLWAKFGEKATPDEKWFIDLMNRAVPHPDLVTASEEVREAVAAVEREGDRQVERAVKAVRKAEAERAMPSESKIVAPPPGPTFPQHCSRCSKPCHPRTPGTCWQHAPIVAKEHGVKERRAPMRPVVVRRETSTTSPPPIRSGFEPKPITAPSRPAGQRVATVPRPAPITKADPLAGVRSGRGGEVSF